MMLSLEKVTDYIKGQVGKPYIDALEFVTAAYREAGVEINCNNLAELKNSSSFEKVRNAILSKNAGLLNGDIILYRYSSGELFHVAIYANNSVYHPLNHAIGIFRNDYHFLSDNVDTVLRYKPASSKKAPTSPAKTLNAVTDSNSTPSAENAVEGEIERNK